MGDHPVRGLRSVLKRDLCPRIVLNEAYICFPQEQALTETMVDGNGS